MEIGKFGLVCWLGKCELNRSWDWELLEMATEEEMAAGVAEILWCEQTVAIVRVREVQKRKWKLQTINPYKDKKQEKKGGHSKILFLLLLTVLLGKRGRSTWNDGTKLLVTVAANCLTFD